MKEQDFVGNGIVQGPQTALSASLEPALLMLHGALTIEELWQAAVMALRTAMATHDLSMALFPAENSAGTLRVSNPLPDLKIHAAKIDSMSPVHAVLARHSDACVLRISDDVTEGSLIETPFYKNFMEPKGWRFAVSMIFRENVRTLGWLWLNRGAAQGDFTGKR